MTVTLSELPFLTASLATLSQARWNRTDAGSIGISSSPGNLKFVLKFSIRNGTGFLKVLALKLQEVKSSSKITRVQDF